MSQADKYAVSIFDLPTIADVLSRIQMELGDIVASPVADGQMRVVAHKVGILADIVTALVVEREMQTVNLYQFLGGQAVEYE